MLYVFSTTRTIFLLIKFSVCKAVSLTELNILIKRAGGQGQSIFYVFELLNVSNILPISHNLGDHWLSTNKTTLKKIAHSSQGGMEGSPSSQQKLSGVPPFQWSCAHSCFA